MLLGVTVLGDTSARSIQPLPRHFWTGFLWADRPGACRQSPIKSQQPRSTPSDARYAPVHKVDADLPAEHSEPTALANPLARGRKKAPSKIGRGLDLHF